MRIRLMSTVALTVLVSANASVARAQVVVSQRTWVSSAGNDANDCSRSAPCRTFAGAFAKTLERGEIDVVDAGQYGPFIASKPITVDGNGVVASVSAVGTGLIAINVNAGPNDVITLRNLELNGGGVGSQGIRFVSGKQLILENVRITGFAAAGVSVAMMAGSALGNVVISHSTISNIDNGSGFGIGVDVAYGHTIVSHSVITRNAGAGLFVRETGVLTADSNVLSFNGIAVVAGAAVPNQGSAIMRLSNNDVYGNLTGFACNGGVLATAGNNRKGSNVGGSVPPCSPTATISQQ